MLCDLVTRLTYLFHTDTGMLTVVVVVVAVAVAVGVARSCRSRRCCRRHDVTARTPYLPTPKRIHLPR